MTPDRRSCSLRGPDALQKHLPLCLPSSNEEGQAVQSHPDCRREFSTCYTDADILSETPMMLDIIGSKLEARGTTEILHTICTCYKLRLPMSPKQPVVSLCHLVHDSWI
jgi:hypothetical protein